MDQSELDDPRWWIEQYGYLAVYVWVWYIISRKHGRWTTYQKIRDEFRRVHTERPLSELHAALSNIRTNWGVIEVRKGNVLKEYRATEVYAPDSDRAHYARALARLRRMVEKHLPTHDEAFISKRDLHRHILADDVAIAENVLRWTRISSYQAVSVALAHLQKLGLVEREMRGTESFWRKRKPVVFAGEAEGYVETIVGGVIVTYLRRTPQGATTEQIIGYVSSSDPAFAALKPRQIRGEIVRLSRWDQVGLYVPQEIAYRAPAVGLQRWYVIEHLPHSAEEYARRVDLIAQELQQLLAAQSTRRFLFMEVLALLMGACRDLIDPLVPALAEYSGPYRRIIIRHALQSAIKQGTVIIERQFRLAYYRSATRSE